MKLDIRILRTDNTIERREVIAPRYRKISNAVVHVGTKLRTMDSSICAIRVDGIDKYTWIGNYNKEQIRVIIERELNGTNNW